MTRVARSTIRYSIVLYGIVVHILVLHRPGLGLHRAQESSRIFAAQHDGLLITWRGFLRERASRALSILALSPCPLSDDITKWAAEACTRAHIVLAASCDCSGLRHSLLQVLIFCSERLPHVQLRMYTSTAAPVTPHRLPSNRGGGGPLGAAAAWSRPLMVAKRPSEQGTLCVATWARGGGDLPSED
jgi:hypothetical protein